MADTDSRPEEDRRYIAAKEAIDKLCQLVVLGKISSEEVQAEYERIEVEFASHFPDKKELFRMIYKSRLSRFLEQFPYGITG